MRYHTARIQAFAELGEFLRNFCDIDNSKASDQTSLPWFKELEQTITMAGHKNGWFNRENIIFALSHWGNLLTMEGIENWLERYPIKDMEAKTVALIMAGNIPLVGFHDFVSVLLTGNRALVKLSSNDSVLLPFVVRFLIKKDPTLEGEIEITEGKLSNFDTVIATGSNNTARYFEHYFGERPNIIRKNRNSVAVLNGDETETQLKALGEDIFRYYGLGCRSVSKLFVPKGYDFTAFFEAIYEFSPIIDQNKYANNYDYNKAVYLMSEFKFLDNGFLMLKEDERYASPIATLFYEQYDDPIQLRQRIKEDHMNIQCVVSSGTLEEEVQFGETQTPGLTTYADGVDTVEFLLRT